MRFTKLLAPILILITIGIIAAIPQATGQNQPAQRLARRSAWTSPATPGSRRSGVKPTATTAVRPASSSRASRR